METNIRDTDVRGLRSSHDKKCPKLDREGVCCYIMRIIRAFGALGGEVMKKKRRCFISILSAVLMVAVMIPINGVCGHRRDRDGN